MVYICLNNVKRFFLDFPIYIIFIATNLQEVEVITYSCLPFIVPHLLQDYILDALQSLKTTELFLSNEATPTPLYQVKCHEILKDHEFIPLKRGHSDKRPHLLSAQITDVPQ